MPAPLEFSQLYVQQRRSQTGKHPIKEEAMLEETVKQKQDIMKSMGMEQKDQHITYYFLMCL
jgi:hypothetical protein